jgi:hypothetical protein
LRFGLFSVKWSHDEQDVWFLSAAGAVTAMKTAHNDITRLNKKLLISKFAIHIRE